MMKGLEVFAILAVLIISAFFVVGRLRLRKFFIHLYPGLLLLKRVPSILFLLTHS